LLANPDITVADVADRIGVSPATLYRYLPDARTATSPHRESTSIKSVGYAVQKSGA